MVSVKMLDSSGQALFQTVWLKTGSDLEQISLLCFSALMFEGISSCVTEKLCPWWEMNSMYLLGCTGATLFSSIGFVLPVIHFH